MQIAHAAPELQGKTPATEAAGVDRQGFQRKTRCAVRVPGRTMRKRARGAQTSEIPLFEGPGVTRLEDGTGAWTLNGAAGFEPALNPGCPGGLCLGYAPKRPPIWIDPTGTGVLLMSV